MFPSLPIVAGADICFWLLQSHLTLEGMPIVPFSDDKRFFGPLWKGNQTAAARALTETSKVDHITLVLRSLVWLPVCERILQLCYEPSRPLRSSWTGLLTLPWDKTKHRVAAISFYAPHIWNKLPNFCQMKARDFCVCQPLFLNRICAYLPLHCSCTGIFTLLCNLSPSFLTLFILI